MGDYGFYSSIKDTVTNFRISSRLGALLFDDPLARGSPLVIFSHVIGISDIHKLIKKKKKKKKMSRQTLSNNTESHG